jgi:hypothetical protein
VARRPDIVTVRIADLPAVKARLVDLAVDLTLCKNLIRELAELVDVDFGEDDGCRLSAQGADAYVALDIDEAHMLADILEVES